jgi:cytosine deaminase
MDHLTFMKEAIREAKVGLREGGIPIGSVLVKDGKIIGREHDRRIQENSPVFHAEMDCLENAGRLEAQNYRGCTLYSTLSPCDMCSGAVLLYKIPAVVIGENTTFTGAQRYLRERGVDVINLDLEECKELMKNYIAKNPRVWNEDVGEQGT